MNRRRSSRTRSRAGWQLIELSMVLSVLAIISVAATKLIVSLLAIENRSAQTFHDATILCRLSDQWRSDLHQSRDASLVDDGRTCRLHLADGAEVTYQIDGSHLRREEQIAGRRSPARESFTASARSWQFEKDKSGRLISIVRESQPIVLTGTRSASAPMVIDRIDGALGTLQLNGEKQSP